MSCLTCNGTGVVTARKSGIEISVPCQACSPANPCDGCEYLAEGPIQLRKRCLHPMTGLCETDPIDEYATTLKTALQTHQPAINMEAALALGIRPIYEGVQAGEFNWPYDFDPKWLEACRGRTKRKGVTPTDNRISTTTES